MRLKVLLPSGLCADVRGVRRLTVDTPDGSQGFWPHRLDCVMVLVPGILAFESEEEGESYLAVDEGILIKTGEDIRVSVRRAVRGGDLAGLKETVEKEFLARDAEEKEIRSARGKMESGLLHRLAAFHHE